MNTSQIKAYAPKARQDFIKSVTSRAHLLGLDSNPDKIKPIEVKGDVAFINNQVFPAKIGKLRKSLETRIAKEGFDQVMEHVAYTWFNRFMALRYMELHGYLSHGCRVLSNPSGSHIPEILEHAIDIDLPELNREEVMELKLAGNKDEELYALLIKAQCHALHHAMPFLFERLDDETELLLPDNLLHSGSLVHKLVEEIDEDSWDKVEIIGWIYQFYISEKKDQVIGKVVKSEDIPAATQLFTPNWIVKYMVQNSLGRMWLATYPESLLRKKMEYYIEPAEQIPEVQAELDAITPKSLNPEELTLLDPACGSGHILVEAYDIFKEIYLERGYRTKDIPRLILQKNLYGLDIDDRAAQLTGFALMMKARADNHNIFNLEPPIELSHFRSVVSSACLDGNVIADALLKETVRPIVDEGLLFPETKRQQVLTVSENSEVQRKDIIALVDLFKNGKTFGSLITIPDDLAEQLPAINHLMNKDYRDDWNKQDKAEKMKPIVDQAIILAGKYDCVVANPPYMGNKFLIPLLKSFLKESYKGFEKDLFSAFMIRDLSLTKKTGQLGFMSPFVWMFISSYEGLRQNIIDCSSITTLIQLEYSGFEGATVPICTFTLGKVHIKKFIGSFIRLSDFRGSELQGPKTLEAIRNPKCGWFFTTEMDNFKRIPGSPIAYWVNQKVFEIFDKIPTLESDAPVKSGMSTTNNDRFLRLWFEIDFDKIKVDSRSLEDAKCSKKKWFPYKKGGDFRKWAGNDEYVVNWFNDGEEIKAAVVDNPSDPKTTHWSRRIFGVPYFFKTSLTYSRISSSKFSVRYSAYGSIFSDASNGCFPGRAHYLYLGFLNSLVCSYFLRFLCPTLNFMAGDVQKLPSPSFIDWLQNHQLTIEQAVRIAQEDWDSCETSWGFQKLCLIIPPIKGINLAISWGNLESLLINKIKRMKTFEEENNRLFIHAYELQNELSPEVHEDQITLTSANRERDCKHLISYAIGCMMGRYSLDESGLIYAHSGNIDINPTLYSSFPADDDGIVPITDELWFEDDATNRIHEFLLVVWGADTLDENILWLAESLGKKGNETPEETIRRYLSTSFFKDHLQTYKKRPIYWLFSSGKYKAFECIVYLHRYNDATLSRIRGSYVIPLQGKISARIDYLKHEIDTAESTTTKRRLSKDMDLLIKKQTELKTFDEELRHYADQKISLDLDDGVKVNYAKFGNLLAEVKAVTGKE